VILLRSTVTQAEQSIAQQQATPHPSTQDTISQGENADNTDHHDVDEDDPDALVGNIDDLSSEEEESVKGNNIHIHTIQMTHYREKR
jgi:hypothetical protein